MELTVKAPKTQQELFAIVKIVLDRLSIAMTTVETQTMTSERFSEFIDDSSNVIYMLAGLMTQTKNEILLTMNEGANK